MFGTWYAKGIFYYKIQGYVDNIVFLTIRNLKRGAITVPSIKKQVVN